jgi:hypothetical protein
MSPINLPRAVHPAGELPSVVEEPADGPMVVDTYAGPVRVEWDSDAAVTALGHFAFFVEYLKLSGRFDALVAEGGATWSRPIVPPATMSRCSRRWPC